MPHLSLQEEETLKYRVLGFTDRQGHLGID